MAKTLQTGTVDGAPIIADVSYLGGPRLRVTIGPTDYVMQNIQGGHFPRRLYGIAAQPSYPITCAAGTTVELLEFEARALVTAGAATYA